MDESPARDLSQLRIDRTGPARRGRGRARGLYVLAVLVALAAAVWFFGRDRIEALTAGDSGGDALETVRAVSAASVRPSGNVSANGYVVARRRAALSTVLAGRLVEIHVEEGDRVEAGQALARIQFDDYEVALRENERSRDVAAARENEAEADIRIAEAALAEARDEVEVARTQLDAAVTEAAEAARDEQRKRESARTGVISTSEWDRIQTRARRTRALEEAAKAEWRKRQRAVDTARATVAARKATVATLKQETERVEAACEQARINLEKTFIRAPFAGVIIDKNAEEGEVVAATGAAGNSRGSVATLVDLDTLEVQVELPETRLAGIHEDMKASLYLDADPTRGWPGAVRQIWPKADRQKGTVEIRVTFSERPPTLRPEMGVRVVFGEDVEESAQARGVLVPASAVVERDGKTVVFAVRDGLIRRVPVGVAGTADDGRIRITSGIRGGTQVVAEPSPDLTDGRPLKEGR